jgi:hypothetical protein
MQASTVAEGPLRAKAINEMTIGVAAEDRRNSQHEKDANLGSLVNRTAFTVWSVMKPDDRAYGVLIDERRG